MLFPRKPFPSPPPRVMITGAGIVTSLGLGWKQNATAFQSGKTGFRRVTLFDVSRQRVKTAAEVDLPSVLPPGRLTKRQQQRLDRAGVMLLLAAQEAWQQSGWKPSDNLPVVLGTTAGGMSLGEDYFRQAGQFPRTGKGCSQRGLCIISPRPRRPGWRTPLVLPGRSRLSPTPVPPEPAPLGRLGK